MVVAVGKAYSVLSDPTRRNQYDRFGEDGLRTQGVGPEQQDVSPDDIFKMFFGENYSFSSHDSESLRTCKLCDMKLSLYYSLILGD